MPCVQRSCVNVTVTNVGPRAAVAVPQLYLLFPPEAQQPAPILKGFAALGPIRPGASDWNVFRLRDRDVSYFTPDLGWVRASGLTAQVAESSRDVKASIKLQTYASGRYI